MGENQRMKQNESKPAGGRYNHNHSSAKKSNVYDNVPLDPQQENWKKKYLDEKNQNRTLKQESRTLKQRVESLEREVRGIKGEKEKVKKLKKKIGNYEEKYRKAREV